MLAAPLWKAFSFYFTFFFAPFLLSAVRTILRASPCLRAFVTTYLFVSLCVSLSPWFKTTARSALLET